MLRMPGKLSRKPLTNLISAQPFVARPSSPSLRNRSGSPVSSAGACESVAAPATHPHTNVSADKANDDECANDLGHSVGLTSVPRQGFRDQLQPQMGGAGKVAPGVAVVWQELSPSSAQILNELQ